MYIHKFQFAGHMFPLRIISLHLSIFTPDAPKTKQYEYAFFVRIYLFNTKQCSIFLITGMKCGRNKATAILVELANMKQKELSDRMNNNAFSISTDGSNDASSKQYPIVVRTRDSSTGLVDSELLSIPVCNDAATGENIFNLVNNDLKSRDVDWMNWV